MAQTPPTPTLLLVANGATSRLIGPFPSAESAQRIAGGLPAGVTAITVPITVPADA